MIRETHLRNKLEKSGYTYSMNPEPAGMATATYPGLVLLLGWKRVNTKTTKGGVELKAEETYSYILRVNLTLQPKFLDIFKKIMQRNIFL